MTRKLNEHLSRRLFQILSICVLVLVCHAPGFAQTAPPDAPVLISEDNSTRALSVNPVKWRRGQIPASAQTVWTPGGDTRLILFVTNINGLLDGEGADAFRVKAEVAGGRRYPLAVEAIAPVSGLEWIYAVTVRLNPELGDVGDVLVRVTWRGMTTNRTRLAIGHLGGGLPDDTGAQPTPAPLVPPKSWQQSGDGDQSRFGLLFSGDRVRFMEQATFGPTADLDARLRRIDLSVYLGDQFDTPYPSTPYPVLPLQPDNVPAACTGDCFRDNYTMYPLQRWFYTDALYGQAQLRRRVAWALSEILVVSGADITHPSRMLIYLQVLDKNAFGNFRTLLRDITLNPAMGDYLDMINSTKNNPNENYAREILQLFTIGLFQLNQDGTLMLDGMGNPIPTYDQNTVNNFTKVFTGWRLATPSPVPGTRNFIDDLVLVQANHDVTAKTLLSYTGAVNPTLPAGQDGALDLTQALDNIFYHPNVGPFISKQLIQKLVTSDPTPAYVGRVAAVFNNNGQGVRGDLKSVVRAILLDPEARGDVKNDPDYGHLREPVLLVTNLLRQFNVSGANRAPGSQSDGYINPQTQVMSQDVFRPPTVFSYYPPDYIVPSTTTLAPEFGIMTTSTTLRRVNFVNTMVFGTIPATTGGNTNAPFGTAISMSEMQALAAADSSGAQLVEALNKKMMHGTMSNEMRNIVTTAVLAVASSNPLLRAQTAVYLVATSSQFQVQR